MKGIIPIQKHTPHPGLEKYIQCYWTITCSDRDVPEVVCELPLDAGLDIVFNLSGSVECAVDQSEPVTIDADFVVGSFARHLRIKPIGEVLLFAVRFTPEGLYPFFSMPPVDLSDFCVEIEEVWELNGLGLAALIHNADPQVENLIQAFETFFYNRMNQFRNHSLRIEKAVNMMRSHKGQIPVDKIADRLKISSRQLERKFSERIGISPKQLCRVFRIKNVLTQFNTAEYDCVSLALENGYFDQSHFIHEFKFFTGDSPLKYLKDKNQFPVE